MSTMFVSSNKAITFSILQVNANGVLSFRNLFSDHTPETFPLDSEQGDLIIAPFWYNVDIRLAGQVFYRQTSSPTFLHRVGVNISRAFDTDFSPQLLFIATWSGITKYLGMHGTVRCCCYS